MQQGISALLRMWTQRKGKCVYYCSSRCSN